MKLRDFIATNKNENVKWVVNVKRYERSEFIPKDLLDKLIISWRVNQWEGIIEIILFE